MCRQRAADLVGARLSVTAARTISPRGTSQPHRDSMTADRAIGRSEQIIGPAREEESELSSNAEFLAQPARFNARFAASAAACPGSPNGSSAGLDALGALIGPGVACRIVNRQFTPAQ